MTTSNVVGAYSDYIFDSGTDYASREDFQCMRPRRQVTNVVKFPKKVIISLLLCECKWLRY